MLKWICQKHIWDWEGWNIDIYKRKYVIMVCCWLTVSVKVVLKQRCQENMKDWSHRRWWDSACCVTVSGGPVRFGVVGGGSAVPVKVWETAHCRLPVGTLGPQLKSSLTPMSQCGIPQGFGTEYWRTGKSTNGKFQTNHWFYLWFFFLVFFTPSCLPLAVL